jgi:hypothetical protein
MARYSMISAMICLQDYHSKSGEGLYAFPAFAFLSVFVGQYRLLTLLKSIIMNAVYRHQNRQGEIP